MGRELASYKSTLIIKDCKISVQYPCREAIYCYLTFGRPSFLGRLWILVCILTFVSKFPGIFVKSLPAAWKGDIGVGNTFELEKVWWYFDTQARPPTPGVLFGPGGALIAAHVVVGLGGHGEVGVRWWGGTRRHFPPWLASWKRQVFNKYDNSSKDSQVNTIYVFLFYQV